jgi:hypothetical protein
MILEGNEIVNYAWGLGEVSNNLVESYTLWCGLNLAKEDGIIRLVMLGDSLFIIQVVINKGNPSDTKLVTLLI